MVQAAINAGEEANGNIRASEIKEIFMLFDKNSDGFVHTKELGTVVRAINLNPTESEINEMERKVDRDSTGQINLQSLENLIRERGKDTDTLDDIINAIKVFDQDNDGKIPVEEFKSVMMKMGERMSEAEIMEIISDSELINNNYIQVVDFAKMIMNRV